MDGRGRGEVRMNPHVLEIDLFSTWASLSNTATNPYLVRLFLVRSHRLRRERDTL